MRLHKLLLTIGVSGLLASSAFAQFTGPVSPYYLDNYNTNTIYVVQGTAVINTFSWFYGVDANGAMDSEGTLAVSGTVDTRGFGSGVGNVFGGPGDGGQYTLGGTATGVLDPYPTPAGEQLDYSFDGTSDGTHNYYVQYLGVDGSGDYTENVYQTDLTWQNPTLLFSVQSLPGEGTEYEGIAYDRVNNSLWLSGYSDTTINDYSLSGTLLSSFVTAGSLDALGFDPADGTLWMTSLESNLLVQYSTTGTLLQVGTPTGGGGLPFLNYLSGDFAQSPVPEPASLVLLATMAAGLFYARRRGNFQA